MDQITDLSAKLQMRELEKQEANTQLETLQRELELQAKQFKSELDQQAHFLATKYECVSPPIQLI